MRRPARTPPQLPIDWVALKDELPDLLPSQFAQLKRELIRSVSPTWFDVPSQPRKRIGAWRAKNRQVGICVRRATSLLTELRRCEIDNAQWLGEAESAVRDFVARADEWRRAANWLVRRYRARRGRLTDDFVVLQVIDGCYRAGFPLTPKRTGVIARVTRVVMAALDQVYAERGLPVSLTTVRFVSTATVGRNGSTTRPKIWDPSPLLRRSIAEYRALPRDADPPPAPSRGRRQTPAVIT